MHRIKIFLFVACTFTVFASCSKGDNNSFNHDYKDPIKYKNDSVGVFVPTAFTPNGDGRNDMFRVLTTNSGFSDYKLTVYKDNGVTAFQTTNVHQAWDGTDGNGHFYTDYHYTVNLKFTIAGNTIDQYSYLYLLPSGSGCVHARSGDITKYFFEDQFDAATGETPYSTAETFCQ